MTIPTVRRGITAAMSDRIRLGIDIGGTGIKGAPVDLDAGTFAAGPAPHPDPEGGKPDDVARVVAEIVAHFPDVDGPVGCTFPAVMSDGVALTAANVDNSWIGTDAQALFRAGGGPGRSWSSTTPTRPAIAEMRFGAGKGEAGVVLMLTLGTGIGSALFVDGVLVAQHRVRSPRGPRQGGRAPRGGERARARTTSAGRNGPSVSTRCSPRSTRSSGPQLITIGGGVSKKSEKFLPHLHPRARVDPGPAPQRRRHRRRGARRPSPCQPAPLA